MAEVHLAHLAGLGLGGGRGCTAAYFGGLGLEVLGPVPSAIPDASPGRLVGAFGGVGALPGAAP